MKKAITLPTAPVTGVLEEAFADVQQSFESFCLAAGMEALGAMMEADVEAVCGPRHGPGVAASIHDGHDPPRHPQREALAQQQNGVAVGRRWHDGGRQGLPQAQGSQAVADPSGGADRPSEPPG